MLTSFIRRSRAALAIIVCATASLSAQVILEPRIASETLPSGGLMQIKMDLTSPHPIIVGNAQFDIADSFDGFEGASLVSPSRDAYGVAFLRGRTLVANIVSPLQSLGTQLDYPFLVIASRIKAGIPTGTQVPIKFNTATIFNGPGGTPYFYVVKDGVLTIGGSVSVTNVIPGGGFLPAGTTVRILGTGFNTSTQL